MPPKASQNVQPQGEASQQQEPPAQPQEQEAQPPANKDASAEQNAPAEPVDGGPEESEGGYVYPSIPESHFKRDLKPLEKPIYEDKDSAEGLVHQYMSTSRIPGLFGVKRYRDKPDCLPELQRITQALQFSEDFRTNHGPTFRKASRSEERKSQANESKPLAQKAFEIVDSIFVRFEVLHDSETGKVLAARPSWKVFRPAMEQLKKLRSKVNTDFVGQGQEIPELPSWGLHNLYLRWRTMNDFEILATAYRHDADEFISKLAPFLPAGSSAKPSFAPSSYQSPADEPNELDSLPYTPTRDRGLSAYGASASEFPARTHATRFFRHDTPTRDAFSGSSAFIGNLLSQSAPISAIDRTGLRNRDRPPHMDEEDPFKEALTGTTPSIAGSHQGGAPGAPDDGSDGSDSEPGRGGRRPIPPRPARSSRRPSAAAPPFQSNVPRAPHFDHKMKADMVPQWDGDEDKLARWIDKVNTLAKMSPDVHRELGAIVPRRLTGEAETWYYSIKPDQRDRFEESWSTLREAIALYWMNHQWLERQKIRANLARFRETGYTRETPTSFVIRKLELIRTVYNFSDTECTQMIMREVPVSWGPIVQPHLCKTLFDFQSVVKYHEGNLIDASTGYGSPHPTARPPYNPPNRSGYQRARVNLVGWSKNMPAPEFPKDDRNVSTPRTPDSVGARPCRHCGSGMHWDKECKHAKQGEKRVRANLAQYDREDLDAQDEYENLYYASDAEDF